MKPIVYWVILLIAIALFSGCTIHFKGENLEMDVERQRVYKFDGVTFTEFAKMDHTGPIVTYRIEKVEIFRSKIPNILHRKTKFVKMDH